MTDLNELKAKMRMVSGKKRDGVVRERVPETSAARVEARHGRKDSRAKGATFENKTAKLWSRWSGQHVRRTPLSGGWGDASFGVVADLVCSDPRWPFAIECKRHEGWDLSDLVTGVRDDGSTSIAAWWRQCVGQCPRGKWPVLAFRRNRQHTLLMVRVADWEAMRRGQPFTVDLVPTLTARLDDGDVVVLAQEHFHLHIDYSVLVKQRKRKKEKKSHA